MSCSQIMPNNKFTVKMCHLIFKKLIKISLNKKMYSLCTTNANTLIKTYLRD